MLLRHGGEGFVSALQNALRRDVNPGAGRHLAVHHQAHFVELIEVFLCAPGGYEVAVGDEYARGMGPSTEYARSLAALHEHGFVGFQLLQGLNDGLILLPVAGSAAGTAVHD